MSEPTLIGHVIAAWPSFALTVSYELPTREVRRRVAEEDKGQAAPQKPQPARPATMTRKARNAKERLRQRAAQPKFHPSRGCHVSDIRSYQRRSVVRARLRPPRNQTPVAITTPAGSGACRSAIERGLTGRPASCRPGHNRTRVIVGALRQPILGRSGIWPSRPSAAPASGLPSNSPACLSRWRSPDMIVSGSGARRDDDKSNLYSIAS